MSADPGDYVILRGTAEPQHAGVDTVVLYEAYRRDEWDAMSKEARSLVLDDLAGCALESIASYGASVLDPAELDSVPADELAAAIREAQP